MPKVTINSKNHSNLQVMHLKDSLFPNQLGWFFDCCMTENASINIGLNDELIWWKGVFLEGTWINGDCYGGTFKGEWMDGMFYNCKFEGSHFLGGVHRNGTMKYVCIANSKIYQTILIDCEIRNTSIFDCIIIGGIENARFEEMRNPLIA